MKTALQWVVEANAHIDEGPITEAPCFAVLPDQRPRHPCGVQHAGHDFRDEVRSIAAVFDTRAAAGNPVPEPRLPPVG